MGCTTPKNSLTKIPEIHMARVRLFLTELQQMADIDNALNVNKRYEHLMRIDNKKFVGAGIRKVINLTIIDVCLLCVNYKGRVGREAEIVLGY